MGDELAVFLARHVETFNAAVATGDFRPLVELFAEDASLEFAGVPVGPSVGRDAIGAAYAAQPPTDTMTVLDTHDGIGIVDIGGSGGRPGLVPPHEQDALVERIHEASGGASRHRACYSRSGVARTRPTAAGRRAAEQGWREPCFEA